MFLGNVIRMCPPDLVALTLFSEAFCSINEIFKTAHLPPPKKKNCVFPRKIEIFNITQSACVLTKYPVASPQ